MQRPPQLGDVLVSVGIISKEELERALQYQREHGGMLGQTLVTLGLCSEDDMRGALEAQRQNTPLAERLMVIKGRETAPSPAVGGPSPEVAWPHLQVLEREIRRVSDDIRDVSRLLGDMSLEVEAARRALSANPRAADTTLSGVWERLRAITREMDLYATELSPVSLDEGNLLTTLKQYASHYESCYGGRLAIELHAETFRTSRPTALGVFRAVQALLRGIGNSEGSHDATLHLGMDGDQVLVQVDFETIRSAEGIAGDPIGEVTERVQLLGGRVERHEENLRASVTCRASIGSLPPATRGGSVVIS
ncbi:MAG: hypothetical protein HY321_10165 [Armatimonadetes bacterium]|nr:hypothetical protein [Armatimonadota bacterium]